MTKSNKQPTFNYVPRTPEQLKARATQSGGAYDVTYRDAQVYSAKDGDNVLRILPPTWEDAQHYGIDVWLHSSIGPDNQSYLCLNKMKQAEPCPICTEISRSDDEEYKGKIRAYKRVLVWVIDRAAEGEGPKLYAMPWTLDRDVTALSVDKRTGEVYTIDNPEEGFDVEFSKTGKGLTTKYIGVQIGRRPSPLSDDPNQAAEWLDYITERPLPDLLVFYPAKHITSVFGGKPAVSTDDDDDDAPPRTKVEPRNPRPTATVRPVEPEAEVVTTRRPVPTARPLASRRPEPEPEEEVEAEVEASDEVEEDPRASIRRKLGR